MKKLLCTICLLSIVGITGCNETEEERVAEYKRENAAVMRRHRVKMMEQGGTLAEMEERLKKELDAQAEKLMKEWEEERTKRGSPGPSDLRIGMTPEEAEYCFDNEVVKTFDIRGNPIRFRALFIENGKRYILSFENGKLTGWQD